MVVLYKEAHIWSALTVVLRAYCEDFVVCRKNLSYEEEGWGSGTRKMISKMLDLRYYTSASVVSVTETCGCQRKLPQCFLSTDYKVHERQTSTLLGQYDKTVRIFCPIMKYRENIDIISTCSAANRNEYRNVSWG